MCGALNGCQGQDLYRQEKNRHAFEEIVWGPCRPEDLVASQALGDGVQLTRRLVNEPPQALDPVSFAQQATELGQAAGLEVDVWDESKLQSEKCGAMLAVARGSTKPARLVILRHQQAPQADAPTLALVGKGVTFDAGGLSLKPTDGMKTMKCDMAGAATVMGTMQAIAQLKLPIHAVGYLGLVENMPGGDAYRLGDVLTARNGKTIEVLNTDAEGRLVLADVLSLAVEHGATRVIDVATLTGACVVALGTDVVGVMTNQQAWCDQVLKAAGECGESAWQLPMFKEFSEQLKSEVADLKNIGASRWGGAITAAKFLEEFVDETPWVHLDIAGPAFLERAKPWQDGGGTGVMVRTLVQLAQQWPPV
jgi:leucyl aminopeptidase